MHRGGYGKGANALALGRIGLPIRITYINLRTWSVNTRYAFLAEAKQILVWSASGWKIEGNFHSICDFQYEKRQNISLISKNSNKKPQVNNAMYSKIRP